MRLRIDLSYDGTDFHGWATQPGLRTVQAEVTSALATVLRDDRVSVVCAGRTDAGVHARGQVVHTDIVEAPPTLVRRLNGVLDTDVRVRRVSVAPPGFDARFSALWRRYVYRLTDQTYDVDPLKRAYVVAWSSELDLDLLNEASARLLGHHDFSAFCRRRPGATTRRTLLELAWARRSSGVVEATVRADAFCHSMVRALVGCLLAIGDGRRGVGWAEEVLGAGVRNPAVTVAHAHGLTLEEVAYPEDSELAARALVTRAKRDG